MFQLQQLMGNPQLFQKQLNNFAQNYSRTFGNMNPQQVVQQLLNSGQMTQAQFNQFRNFVNQITGQRL